MLLYIVRGKESGGRIIVGVKLEPVGNFAIKVKGREPLCVRRRPAERVALKWRQRCDRVGSSRGIRAVLPCLFRPGQGAILHVQLELIAAQTARN